MNFQSRLVSHKVMLNDFWSRKASCSLKEGGNGRDKDKESRHTERI